MDTDAAEDSGDECILIEIRLLVEANMPVGIPFTIKINEKKGDNMNTETYYEAMEVLGVVKDELTPLTYHDEDVMVENLKLARGITCDVLTFVKKWETKAPTLEEAAAAVEVCTRAQNYLEGYLAAVDYPASTDGDSIAYRVKGLSNMVDDAITRINSMQVAG